jgi:hypothetical protein
VTDRHDDQTTGRAAYDAPRLIPLGSVEELTLGDFGGIEDGLTGNLEEGSF